LKNLQARLKWSVSSVPNSLVSFHLQVHSSAKHEDNCLIWVGAFCYLVLVMPDFNTISVGKVINAKTDRFVLQDEQGLSFGNL
jgi:hypothetical protein